MDSKNLLKMAIEKQSSGQGVPFFIRFSHGGYLKHGEEVFKRYANDKIKRAYNDGRLSLYEAMCLAMDNSAFGVFVPWWIWDKSQTEFQSSEEIPHFSFKTFGFGSYEALYAKMEAVKELSNAYVVVLLYAAHLEKLQKLRGMENYMVDFMLDAKGSHKILDYIVDKNVVMLENIVNMEGIDAVLFGSDWGTQRGPLISLELWREMIKPGEKRMYNVVHNANKDVWVHSCGKIEPLIPELIEMGVDVLNPIQPECMDIHKLKDDFGDKITFWGGISTQQTLPNGTPTEVKSETRKIIEYMSQNGGYITGPSQDIQEDVPLENVFALIDTAKEFV
jgi:uroporphyrinogen decarboxylase